MVARTCLNVTLYVQCLSCWVLKYGLSPRRARFDSGSFHVEFVVNKVTLWQLFPPSASVFLCHYHSSSAPFSTTCCSFQTDKPAKPGNLPKSNALYKPLPPISWNSDLQRTSTDKHQLCQIWGQASFAGRMVIWRVRGYLLASSLHCQMCSSAFATIPSPKAWLNPWYTGCYGIPQIMPIWGIRGVADHINADEDSPHSLLLHQSKNTP